MKTLNYSTQISVPKEKVWKTMLDPKKYKEWAKAFSPNSQYIGEWKKGEYIKFIDPDLGGTKAILEELKPFDYILAKHVAIIRKDGAEDTESDVAKSWIGVTEEYRFDEHNGITEISIEIKTHVAYVSMFNDSWPKGLKALKDLCETG